MTVTSERSYFAQPTAGDARARLEAEAERDRHDRLAAVRVVAGLAADATEARELYAMLGLSADEIRAARRPAVTAVTTTTAAGATRPRRSRKVAAA